MDTENTFQNMLIILPHCTTTFFEGGKTGYTTTWRAREPLTLIMNKIMRQLTTSMIWNCKFSHTICVSSHVYPTKSGCREKKYPNNTRPPLTSKLSPSAFNSRGWRENYKSGKIARPVLLTNMWSNEKSATAANVGNPRFMPVLPTKNVMAATKLQLQTK
jgi:hypothetical protein